MIRMVPSALLIACLSFALCGCDSGGPTNVLENADQSALEEYERMIEADNAAMSAEDGDATTE